MSLQVALKIPAYVLLMIWYVLFINQVGLFIVTGRLLMNWVVLLIIVCRLFMNQVGLFKIAYRLFMSQVGLLMVTGRLFIIQVGLLLNWEAINKKKVRLIIGGLFNFCVSLVQVVKMLNFLFVCIQGLKLRKLILHIFDVCRYLH